jgi:hypothetical protein
MSKRTTFPPGTERTNDRRILEAIESVIARHQQARKEAYRLIFETIKRRKNERQHREPKRA